MAERDEVLKIFNQPATAERPPTLEEFPMGGDYAGSMADFVRDHRTLQEQGMQEGLLPSDAQRGPLMSMSRPPLFNDKPLHPERSANTAFNEVFTNAMISGDTTRIGEQLNEAKLHTVEDELVNILIEDFQDEEFKLKQLQTLHELPRDEQLRVLNYELDRRDAQKMTAREALLIHVMRSGQADLSITQFDKMKANFNPVELDQIRGQLRSQQVEELRNEANKVVARMDIGTSGEAALDFVAQDLLPVYNVVSRMILSNTARNAVDADIGFWRSLLPGEVRQEIREQFVKATPEQRRQYIKDIGDSLEELKRGEFGSYFTEYGILENYMGIFTEDLLSENIPTDTLDRVLGNLDVVLESVFNVGLLIKAGGRTTKQAFRNTNTVQARRAARAAGNHKLRAKLDRELQLVIRDAGGDPADAALVHMPKPPTLYGDREVLPDSLRQVVDRNERIADEILIKSDDLTGLGLSTRDKANVVRKEADMLDSYDTMAMNPQMSVLEELPNGTGIKFRAVYGQGPEQGWDNIYDVVDELLEVDPNVENFRILKRNANGELERITLTPDEFARLATKGEIPPSLLPAEPGQRLAAQMINGQPVSTLGDDQLIELSAIVPEGSREWDILNLEARRRANGLPVMGAGDYLRAYDGDEFFLEVDHERFFHAIDRDFLGASTWANTAGFMPRFLIPPNRKFGDEIFGAFDRAYRIETATRSRFEQIYEPFYKLSKSDKEYVTGIMEYVERYAHDNGRIPSMTHLYGQFAEITDDQMKGLLSLQQGLNVQWQMFNRRMYREFHTNGYKTAKPLHNEAIPTYHGDVLARESLGNGRVVYDPLTQKQVAMSADELNDLYNSGGQVMKLDLAIDVPGESGKAATLVKLDAAEYKTGKLDTSVLDYNPGYFSRFYEDPFYIIKQSGKEVDGSRTDLVEDAIRTAGSVEEAERFVRRFSTFDATRKVWVNNEDPSQVYRIQRAAQLDQVESSLFAKQALHREGRLFWDKRNYDRLPSVNGNRSDLENPTVSLQRSTTMATRQTTHEDLMKSMKRSFGNEFKDLLPHNYEGISIKEVIDHLQSGRRNAVEAPLKARYDQAIEFAKYLRIQAGQDAELIPMYRELVSKLASGVSRMAAKAPTLPIESAGFKMSRVLENYAARTNPLRSARSVAFNAFMVFRPARQLLLQSAQISFLTALDPAYVASGRVIKDGLALRSGLAALRKSGYDDGLSVATRAKLMGLTKTQYKRLIDEFDRSGLYDTVDVHSFAGGAPNARHEYAVAQKAEQVRNTFQKYGFDLGEQHNLSFTYMVALRKYMKDAGVKDLMSLSKSQWDEIGTKAQALALGMTKPNKMAYQSGMLGNMTQFLSFSHKALMTVLGQNPAISGRQAIGIALMTYSMFGANMFGAGEWARGKLSNSGLEKWADRELDGFGGTLADLLAFGLMQKGINTIFHVTMEEHKDLDIGFMAPGINATQLWETFFEGTIENPWVVAGGPGGQLILGTFWDNARHVAAFVRADNEVSPADKAIRSMDMMMRTLPAYNDANTARIAALTGRWVSQSGRALPVEFEPVLSSIVARGLVGARTVEELAWYEINDDIYQTKANMLDMVKANRAFMLKQLGLYYDGEITREFLHEQLRTLASFSEGWPEHLRMEILKQSLITEDQEGRTVLGFLAENTKMMTPDIVGLMDQLPDMPAGARDELEAFLNEVFEERVDNNKQFMQEELQDSELWQN